jgi:hypothetical protein
MTHGNPSGRRRRVISVVLPLCAAVGLFATAGTPAYARGPSIEQFDGRGWTCFIPPTVPEWVVCYNSGLGRPIPGSPTPPPSYTFLAFSTASGEFLFTGHLIRADVYADQPCAPDGRTYVLRGLIGYYECVHT